MGAMEPPLRTLRRELARAERTGEIGKREQDAELAERLAPEQCEVADLEAPTPQVVYRHHSRPCANAVVAPTGAITRSEPLSLHGTRPSFRIAERSR